MRTQHRPGKVTLLPKPRGPRHPAGVPAVVAAELWCGDRAQRCCLQLFLMRVSDRAPAHGRGEGEGARAGREAEERGSWGSLPLSWTWPCSVTLPPSPAPASPQGSEAETSAEGSPVPGWKMGFPVAAGREAKVRGGAASQPTASAGTGRPQPRGPSCVQWGERQLSCWLEPVLVAPGGAGGLHEVERVGVARALGQVLLALVHHFSVDQD